MARATSAGNDIMHAVDRPHDRRGNARARLLPTGIAMNKLNDLDARRPRSPCAACGKETAARREQRGRRRRRPATAAAEAPPAAAPAAQPEAGSSDGEKVDAAVSATSPIAAAVAATTPAPPQGDLSRAGRKARTSPPTRSRSRSARRRARSRSSRDSGTAAATATALEPRLEAWEKSKPDWIVLRRTARHLERGHARGRAALLHDRVARPRRQAARRGLPRDPRATAAR